MLSGPSRTSRRGSSMARFAFAFPELPGKDARSIPAFVRENRAQYVESRRRAGVRLERVYLMPTPAGRFAVAYLEAERDFLETQGVFMSSGDPFDQEFMRRLGDVHGFDPTQPPPGPPPEVVAEWWDPEARSRRHGLAFVAPLRP